MTKNKNKNENYYVNELTGVTRNIHRTHIYTHKAGYTGYKLVFERTTKIATTPVSKCYTASVHCTLTLYV